MGRVGGNWGKSGGNVTLVVGEMLKCGNKEANVL